MNNIQRNGKLNLIISRRRKHLQQQHQQQAPLLEAQLAKMLSGQQAVRVAIVPHLYDLAPDGPVLRHLRALEGHMVVLAWLYPRAAYWVLQANGISGRMGRTRYFPVEEMETPQPASHGGPTDSATHQAPSDAGAASATPAPSDSTGQASRTIWCFDLREAVTVESLVEQIDEIALEATGKHLAPVEANDLAAAERLLAIEEDVRPRWYPVVDYSRCKSCLECLNFCLFGVFGLSGGRLVVEDADACRPGCPACARVCPSQAIMFPQHPDPFIAGDPKASPHTPDADLLKQLGLAVVMPGVPEPGAVASAERARALLEKAATAKPAPEAHRDSTGLPAEATAEDTLSEQPRAAQRKPEAPDQGAAEHPGDDSSRSLKRLVDDLEQSDL
jgi:hypothetical protein